MICVSATRKILFLQSHYCSHFCLQIALKSLLIASQSNKNAPLQDELSMTFDVFHLLLPASVCKGGRKSLMTVSMQWIGISQEQIGDNLFQSVLNAIQPEIAGFLTDRREQSVYCRSRFTQIG